MLLRTFSINRVTSASAGRYQAADDGVDPVEFLGFSTAAARLATSSLATETDIINLDQTAQALLKVLTPQFRKFQERGN